VRRGESVPVRSVDQRENLVADEHDDGDEDDGSISRTPINLAHLLQTGGISGDEESTEEGSGQEQMEDEPSSDGSFNR